MGMKQKVSMILFLLIAFITIGIAVEGLSTTNNVYVLNQIHDFNGTTYTLNNVIYDPVIQGWELDINQFKGSKPIIFSGRMLGNNFDYNSQELNNMIETILFNDCVNRKECVLPIVGPQQVVISADLIDANLGFFETIYTKSKVPSEGINYCKLIMDSNIYHKSQHYAYKLVNGKYVLDAEYRWMVLEGCEKQKLTEMCLDKKYSWCVK